MSPKILNTNHIDGKVTKTETGSPVTSYYDNLAAPNSGLMYANTCAYQKLDQGTNIVCRGSTYFPFGIVLMEPPVVLGSPHVPVRRRLDSERGSLVQGQPLVTETWDSLG
jgi:hypothetical protein